MKTGAVISSCGKYRYQLWRIWDESKPCVMWFMHNPSTADADQDDPTIRRIINFSKAWGYGGLYVGNVTPYRSSDPKKLKKLSGQELQFVENKPHLRHMKKKCRLFIMACGNSFSYAQFSSFNYMRHPWHYLKLTKGGEPVHPLYLKSDLLPKPFVWEHINHGNGNHTYRIVEQP